MFVYVKYFVFFYLGFYILLHWLLRGKVTIGFISWLHLINVRVTLSELDVSMRSVSLQIRPMYYLHRKKLKATHHDGLIVIHIYQLKVDVTKLNSAPHTNTNVTEKKKTPKSHAPCSTDTILKVLQWARWILPLTIVLHNFFIVNGDKWVNIETLSTSFNCNLETNKKTKQRELRNSLHISVSNLYDLKGKIIKDLKWTFVGSTPLSDICSPKLTTLISSCVGHGIRLDLDELKELKTDLFPKRPTKSMVASNEKTETRVEEIESSPDNRIDQLLENFDKTSIYFTFDDTKIITKGVMISVKNMLYSINSIDKTDIHINFPSSRLYKTTINISGFQMVTNLLKSSKFQMEFFNFVSTMDVSSIFYCFKNIHDVKAIQKFSASDSFIMKNFLTITNSTFVTTVDDILELVQLLKQRKLKNKQSSKNKKPVVIDETENAKKRILFDNVLRLTHKFHVRAQFLTSMVQVRLSKLFNVKFVIDDVLLDSSMNDDIASLFEVTRNHVSTKSLFLAIRNIQFSVIDAFVIDKLFILDLFDCSVSVSVTEDSVTIDDVNLYIHHIEFLAENIEVFKKLSAISTKISNRDCFVNKVSLNEKPIETCNSTEEPPRDSSCISRLIHSVKFTIHRITLTACFSNPVKYWDGLDQSKLNAYKRGITISLLEMVFLHDNTCEIPISDIKLSDVTLYLIRDYELERQTNKSLVILNLKKYHSKYTYMNNRLSMVMPLIDITVSVEVLWTFFFVMTILKSITGKKNRNEPVEPKNKNKEKPAKYPLNLLIALPLLMLRLKLPADVELAFELDSLKFTKLPFLYDHSELSFKVFRIYGENPHAENFWTLLAIVSNAHVLFMPKHLVNTGDPGTVITCDDIRIEIPYQYIFYKTFDNLKAFFKSIKKIKLNFHDLMFIEDSDKEFKVDTIKPSLASHPMKFPHVRIKSKRILYCNHDDPFEENLTGFLMLGRMEQIVRLSKLKAFEKYEAIIMKKLKEKYKDLLVFRDDIAIMPNGLKKVAGNLPSPVNSTEMKKSFSTGLFPSITLNRRRNSTISSNIPSRLSNQVFGEECEAWLNYQRDYHMAIEIPKNRLFVNISKSWINRVKTSYRMKTSTHNTNGRLINDPKIRKEFIKRFPVVVEGNFEPLFGFKVMNSILDLKEPLFGLDNYPEFMHRVGGGMPKDMKYGILVPMNLQLSCSELKIQIKDYPLPLLGFGGDVEDGNNAVKFSGDMVVCEQAYTEQEIRYNFVPAVHQYNDPLHRDNLYAFHIGRTMTNVKFVTDMNVFVDTKKAAAVSWAPCLQPGMHYAFDSFDLLSKPPLDISDKIGFWDKMPLLVPSKFTFHLKNGITLFIKSSQSPYHMIGKHAGFAFRWDKDVKVSVNSNNKPEDFLIVESKVFEIAVPAFDPYFISNILFQGIGSAIDYTVAKVILKLTSEPIVWKLGFAFERNKENQKHVKLGSVERIRNFKPHYEVTLRNPDTFTDEKEKENWDSYEGWRSHYIYLSVGLYSRDDNKCKNMTSCPLGTAYNSLYLTPTTFMYFFYWWNSFKSSLGLPIKTGKLFANKFLSEKKSPKFGASIYGLSYVVDLSPLYLTHVYQHASSGTNGGKVAFTGLKCFVKSFTMDLHQTRREVTIVDEKTKTVTREYKLKMNKGIVDFIDADLRILTAVFNQASAAGLLVNQLGIEKSSTIFSDSDTSSSTASEDYLDVYWYDHNDFIELESQRVPDEEPKWKVYQFASSPRFYYVRDTPCCEVNFPFELIQSKTHDCQLNQRNLSQAASALAETRLLELEDQIAFHNFEIKDLESKPGNEFIKSTLETLKSELLELRHRLHILRCLKDKFSEGIFPEYDEFMDDEENSEDEIEYEISKTISRVSSRISRAKSRISTAPIQSSTYRNRFSVYAIDIKWTKQVKSGFLRYLENVKDRRFLSFTLSQQALNLANELSKTIDPESSGDPDLSFMNSDPQAEFSNSSDLLFDFDQELHDTTGLSESETEDAYLLKFILPQIAITANNDKCLLLTSNQIVLRSVIVKGFNYDRTANEITMPMEVRNGLTLTDAFVYILDRKALLANKYRFFTPKSFCWPPQLPIEMYYTPVSLDDSVIVQDLSCALLYNKPNEMHYCKDQKNENFKRKEVIRVVAPDVNIILNSEQYNIVYAIFTSMFTHDETEIQKVKEAVKKFVRYSDFSDFRELYVDLKDLQVEARLLYEYRRMMVNANFADNIDIADDIQSINIELERILLNINAIVDILQTSKAKRYNVLHMFSQWTILAPTIKIQLMSDDMTPFVEFSAIDAYYMFTKSPNDESINTVYIFDFAIFDKHKAATYETVASRAVDNNDPMLRLDWSLLAPVGGIQMVKQKVFAFAPLKVEFDMRFANALQEFIFPKSKILERMDDFDGTDTDDLFSDVNSTDSQSSSIPYTSTNLDPKDSIHSLEKEGFKFSRAIHKLMHKRSADGSSRTGSKTLTEDNTVSFSNPAKTPLPTGSLSKVKIMEERSSKFFMVSDVVVKETNLTITFKGSGKYSIVNLTDFRIKIPKIEITNRMMSNEELFAIIRNKLIHYILRNTHNVIKSTLKTSKSSKGSSLNPKINPILKMNNRKSTSSETDTPHASNRHTVSHKHNMQPHRFRDTDLLEPQVPIDASRHSQRRVLESDTANDRPNNSVVDEASIFQQLDDVQEEEEND